CETRQRTPEPSSGNLRLRMRPRVHAQAVQAAAIRGLSLNAWIEEAILRTARLEVPRA
ncbi:MAG: toxin-antitoxin system HicB family antitoxin, partial [Gluconacetobacter diazotrophicus]|nr:toxin-antitoxin system HicB family antitoxin [Gluconacetobacter diazotrophicus]